VSGLRQLCSRERTVLGLPLGDCGEPVADLECPAGSGGHPGRHADALGGSGLDNLTVNVGIDSDGELRRRVPSERDKSMLTPYYRRERVQSTLARCATL
jgi:hypothetical protein